MSSSAAALLLLLGGAAVAQQIGTAVPEVHPKLPTQFCTTAGGCKTMQTSLVTDALSRALHAVGQPSVACDVANKTQCPDATTCSKNCALEGYDYAAHGVSTTGNAMTLRLFNGSGASVQTLSPRVYLLAEDDKNYQLLKLANQEFTYDVDMSKVGCGVNGALYLSEMDASGGRSAANQAGAQYGTGYCDAQCFNTTFINGLANFNNSGACCNEMDIWEANNAATAMTPHTCSDAGLFQCTGDACGRGAAAACDKNGCGINPYRAGAKNFYAPGGSVDTSKPFTVVTQFLTSDNATTGSLAQIRRLYIQSGKMVSSATKSSNGSTTSLSSLATGFGTITEDFCTQNGATDFVRLGGLQGMGKSLARGMVLIFSIWDAPGDFMTWLDSGEAGPCSATQGDPKIIAMNNSDAAVTFSNIRWGDIGSTIKMSPNGSIVAATDLALSKQTSGGAPLLSMSLSTTILGGLAMGFGYLLM
ncbi:endo-beta-1,4-glucanase celB [Sporothrix brasiliensis 5110]|uniref:Glucanase n=1 Tax=Sporothrix brasiliensis 5110 TaxID=1398154 RepID=A0A0C2IBE4_9PEZI|nr:endo-beta-1,4-glucanase celB [Sporothrix brasiliensis 5110]KIH86576.1 endo-beta-1,4-glucanase celB [Sporothrix brasiliensis 5110]